MFRYPRRKEGSLLSAALSGIDMALWDIKGKALGVPVWKLPWGKARNRVALHAHAGGGSAKEAAELCRELAPTRPWFVEDPIRPEDPLAYRRVRNQTNLPLASGENLYSKWQFRPLAA